MPNYEDKIQRLLALIYETLDLLAYVDSDEVDRATALLSKAANITEGLYSRFDPIEFPDSEEDDEDRDIIDDIEVVQLEFDFRDDPEED